MARRDAIITDRIGKDIFLLTMQCSQAACVIMRISGHFRAVA